MSKSEQQKSSASLADSLNTFARFVLAIRSVVATRQYKGSIIRGALISLGSGNTIRLHCKVGFTVFEKGDRNFYFLQYNFTIY